MDAVVKTSGVERALADQFAAVLPRLPGGKAVPLRAPARSMRSRATGCRTAGSRTGSTRICAR